MSKMPDFNSDKLSLGRWLRNGFKWWPELRGYWKDIRELEARVAAIEKGKKQ